MNVDFLSRWLLATAKTWQYTEYNLIRQIAKPASTLSTFFFSNSPYHTEKWTVPELEAVNPRLYR
jgi:hypothetical protein